MSVVVLTLWHCHVLVVALAISLAETQRMRTSSFVQRAASLLCFALFWLFACLPCSDHRGKQVQYDRQHTKQRIGMCQGREMNMNGGAFHVLCVSVAPNKMEMPCC